jgi:hypothetical protein
MDTSLDSDQVDVLRCQIAAWAAAENAAKCAGLALAVSLLPPLRLTAGPHPSASATLPGGGQVQLFASAGQEFTFHLVEVPAHAAQALVDEAMEIGYFECLETRDGQPTESIADAIPEVYGQARQGLPEDELTVGRDGRCSLSLHGVDALDAARGLTALRRAWNAPVPPASSTAEAEQSAHRLHCRDCGHPCSPSTGTCWTDTQHEHARTVRQEAEDRDEAAYRAGHDSDD